MTRKVEIMKGGKWVKVFDYFCKLEGSIGCWDLPFGGPKSSTFRYVQPGNWRYVDDRDGKTD